MAYSLPHTIDEIQALFQKLIEEDIVRQKAIMELAVELENASTTTDDLRKGYEKCNDIPQESHALIDTFLKQESDKDCKMHLAMYSKAVGTLTTIESLKKPCIAGFMKPINSTLPPTPPLHHRSPPPTSSSVIVTPSTPNPPLPNPSTTVCRHYCKP
nr:hypothetical protein [Tanacetum cinerariifolium]